MGPSVCHPKTKKSLSPASSDDISPPPSLPSCLEAEKRRERVVVISWIICWGERERPTVKVFRWEIPQLELLHTQRHTTTFLSSSFAEKRRMTWKRSIQLMRRRRRQQRRGEGVWRFDDGGGGSDDNDDPSAETLTRHFDEWFYYSPPFSSSSFCSKFANCQ